MADINIKKDYFNVEMLHFIIIIGVINGISPCVGTIESHGQAFIQTDNNELRYMVDGHIDGVPFNVIPENNIQTSSLNDGSLSATPIRFQPAILDFREQPVGIPHMEQVTVQNPDVHHSLHLLSISGSSQHFHCSFFQDKMVSPGGNTSFDVVFLARQLGNVENTLYIHTSQGSFKYQVLGVGVPNPYRVQPFLGAKLPINSSFSSLIHLHNPHSSTLQVVEMYSSAGDLHLELPTGEKEAPSNLWEIPPYETKSVMKASFYGREESNHTAFIRIRTNQEQHHDTLVVPVEVEVTSSPGIFSTQSEMYFGILRTSDSPKVLRLNLLNHGSEAIYITSVSLAEPNEAISIDFRPIKLHPDVLQATQVAIVSFTASKATDISQFHGTIYVKTKHGHPKLSVPYYANVLHGSLVYDTNRTQFYTGYKEIRNVSRDFVFTNTFNFTLVIYNVSLSSVALPHLTISEFSSPTLLEPQKSATVFSLDLAPQENLLHFTTELSLYTNASVFTVPIVLYNGRLKVIHHRPEIFKGQLDFGTLGIEEPRSMSFTLRNDNPIDIICREFGANMERTIVEFLGVEAGNGTLLTRVHNTSEIDTDPLILKPYHYAVFNLNLTAPDWEGTFAAEVIIVTQNENLYIPMTLRTAEGSLNSVPEKIILDKCFPSKLPYKELQIHSLFTSYMEVRKVTFQPNDTRFYYVPPKHKPVLLEPQQDNIIGRIYFDPRRECKEDCYLSLPTSVVAGHHWLVGATLDKEVTDTDQYLYTRFQQKWQEIGQQQLNTINVTVQLDTNSLRGFLFPAQAHLHWPTLTKKWKIRFPLTQIGNISYSEFIVENPSDARVLMQILPLPLYPNPQTIIDMLHQRLQNEFTEYIEIDDNDIFLLPDLEAHNASLENTVPALRRGIEASLGVKPHKNTIAMIVEGGTKVRVRVAFKPKDDLFRTSLILIRNNLTIIDAVIVQGQGGLGELRFSNRKHGSSQPLMFEMTEKHLKGCDKRKQSKNISPSFTVKRTFTARNTGQLPFWVNDFYINDARCQGYGFMVLDCEGFELAPNASKKVDIAVTPDFTMSRMRRTLSLHTSLGTALNYTLQVTIPPHMLSKCASALPRPTCEPVLYYMAVCITVFMILGVCVAAYFEADHIYTADILRRHSKSGTSSPAATNGRTFDLKAIGVAAGKTIVNDKSVNVQKVAPTSAVNAQNTANIASEINHKRSKNQSQHSSPTSTTPSPTSPTPPTPSRPTASSFSWLKRLGRIVFSAAANLFSESDRPTHPSREPERPASSSRVQPLPLQATGSAAKLSAGQDKPMSIVAPTRSTIHPTHTEDIPMKPKLKSKSARNRNHDASSLDQRKSPPPSAAPTTPYVQEIAPRTGRGTADLDDFDDLPLLATPVSKLTKDSDMTDLYNIDDDVRSNASSTSSKHANKKSKSSKKAKSSSITRQEARRQREKRQQELLLEADKDETSSTTTESSNADIDEKCVSTRESTPDETHQLKRRSKSSSGATGAVSKKERATKTTSLQSTGDEDEFIVTSRKQKHIKIDTKSTTGGNILKPSTLELPYLCKIEASKSETPLKDPSDAKPKKGKSSKKKSIAVLTDTDSSSSTPIWDQPWSNECAGDLSDLALQTQQFIKTSVAAATSKAETASTTAAARRGSSYSSILSSGISSAPPIPTTNTPASNTTTGLTDRAPGSHNTAIPNYIPGNGALGVAKQMAALNLPNFGQMPPTTVPLEMAFSGPGTIGMKSSTQPSSSPQPVSPSGQLPWMMSPNLAAPGTISPNVMSTTEPPVNNALVNHFTAQGQHTYPAVGNEGPQFGGSSYAQDKENATIMQKLQMERRLRYAEYQQKVNAEEDWPGFNLPSQSSLWDDKMSSNNWSAAMSDVNPVPTTSRAQPGLGLWSSPPPQTSQPPPPPSTWNPIGSIWNPNTAPPPTAPMDAASGMVHGGNYPPAQPPTNLPPTQGPQQGSYPSFSLGNIWNPSVAPPQMTPSPPASGAEPVPPGGWGYPGMGSPPGSNSNQNNNNE